MSEEQLSTQLKEFTEYYITHPIDAAYDIFNQKLWWGQREAIRAYWEGSYNLLVSARGTGKTRLMALLACLKALLLPGEKVVITSASFRQAKLVFGEVEKIYDEAPIFASSCKKPPVRLPDNCLLNLKHGASITALPLGDGSTILGTRSHTLIADEFARIPVNIVHDVLLPMLNTVKNPMENVERIKMIKRMKAQGVDTKDIEDIQDKHCVLFSSTAYFQFNHLYKFYKEWGDANELGDDNYNVCSYNYLDPPEGFINIENVEMEKKTQSPIRFMMEHLSIFPQDSENFYKASLVNKMKDAKSPVMLSNQDNGIYIIGIDPARTGDNFAISVIKVEGDKQRLVFLKAFTNRAYPAVALYIRMLIALFKPQRVSIDKGAGGAGMPLFDELNKLIFADDIKAITKEHADLGIDLSKIEYFGAYDEIKNNPVVGGKGEMLANSDKRYLIDLVNFSNEWIAESNLKLKSMMMTTPTQVIVPSALSDDVYADPNGDAYDEVLYEINQMCDELLNIKMTQTKTAGHLQFVAADKRIRRDRYTSFVIATRAASDYMKGDEEVHAEESLADGFWGQF